MKIWLDTDIGGDIDDALALLLAMSYEDVELVGVSTVFQNTVARAKIAKKLLELGGKNDIKVYAGRGKPFKATKVFNDPVDLVTPPKTYISEMFDSVKIEKKDGVEALKEAILQHEDLVVVTLGALTNLASLILEYPEVVKRIHKLYVMGTAVWLNLNEFNISCDPEAAAIVFSSSIPMKVVSLDVTFKCGLSKEQVDILKSCKSDLVQTVLAMSEMWGEGMILHDPLTLSEAVKEQFVKFVPGNLKVELEGEFSRGKCVNLCDFNWKREPKASFEVSTEVDAKAFTDFYVNNIYLYDKRI